MPIPFQIYVEGDARPQPSSSSHEPRRSEPENPNLDKPKPAPLSSVKQQDRLRFIPTKLDEHQRFHFDEKKIYPIDGGEFSFEEINFLCWSKRQRELMEKAKLSEVQKENDYLKLKVDAMEQQLLALQEQIQQMRQLHLQQQQQLQQQQTNHFQHPPSPPLATGPSNRLSIVPQSLKPSQGLEYNDQSCHYGAQYGAFNEATSVINHCWRESGVHHIPNQDNLTTNLDKFTVPINNSQWMKDNVEASTPKVKRNDEEKRVTQNNQNRRQSRPSMGGSPTLKLSPITETSRDCNSKSSSSSSAMSATPSTVKKLQPMVVDQADGDHLEPLNPNDPSTYRRLLRVLPEPLDRRAGYYRVSKDLPKIRPLASFYAGSDEYLVDKELCSEPKICTAQLLDDDSNVVDTIKMVCIRIDEPANEWLFYICNELHRRLVKQKTKPDIELSIMIATPAIMFNNGSVLVDEYFRFVTLQHFFDACIGVEKPFPKAVAAYVTLELIQLVRQMHTCDIIHMNINPKNILITCCPNREDITSVGERTSIVKLIGFDRAMDTRLLPADYKFDAKIDDMMTCEMRDSKPWSVEIDWFGILNCIHKMFFIEDMKVEKNEGRWTVNRTFKGFPTNVWSTLFDELLNIEDKSALTKVVEETTDELDTWIKANINFVLRESQFLDEILESYNKFQNKDVV